MIIYLGHASRRVSCSLPGTAILCKELGDEQPPLYLQTEIVPAWPCSRWGLPGRGCCHPRRWSFTLSTTMSSIKRMRCILPPFHPCRHYQDIVRWLEMLRRSVSVARSRRFLPSGRYPAPCSVECGLSSAVQVHSRDHPVNQRYIHHTSLVFNRQMNSTQTPVEFSIECFIFGIPLDKSHAIK
jgi:hypothetical protein